MQNVAAAQVLNAIGAVDLPLVRGDRHPRAVELLRDADPSWFADAESPEGALAGLFLAAGDWDRAHQAASSAETKDCSYWHGIVHRMEPDPINAQWWFGQVGRHVVYEELGPRVAAIPSAAALGLGQPWNAGRFVNIVWEGKGGPMERVFRDVQNLEWRLLFEHCSRSADR